MDPKRTVYKGKRVCLKRPGVDEIEYSRNLWSDPDTMKEVGGPITLTDQELLDWYATKVDPGNESNCYFHIINENKEPIGEVSFRGWNSSTREANLNIKIESRFRGRGYASDALRSFLKYCFEDLGTEKLIDDLDPENIGAKQFLEKFGFEDKSENLDPRTMVLFKKRYFELAQQVAEGDATR
ncbi:MAG: GNAT family N-acetyltransferase [Puniceicoccaceae bacterium]